MFTTESREQHQRVDRATRGKIMDRAVEDLFGAARELIGLGWENLGAREVLERLSLEDPGGEANLLDGICLRVAQKSGISANWVVNRVSRRFEAAYLLRQAEIGQESS